MSNGTENTATGTGTISAETPSTDTPSTGTLFEIKHRYTDAVLYSGKHATLKGAVEAAIAARAYLDGAYLDGATINWQSHWLLSELLWRKADSPSQEQLAAWIGRKTDLCWNEWIKLDHPDRAWALETLKKHVRDGDNAPDILRSPSSVTP